MKVELNSEELDIFMSSHRDLQNEVVRLTGEVARLQSRNPVAVDSTNNLVNVLTNVCAELSKGNKISAIKLVREFTHLGLKEAKDIVEGCYYGPGVSRVI